VKKTREIFAVTSAILCVLRAFDFFQQIKRDIQSSQRKAKSSASRDVELFVCSALVSDFIKTTNT
jgi:Na+/H+ antiporter NhaD/arsenite permease-like protein